MNKAHIDMRKAGEDVIMSDCIYGTNCSYCTMTFYEQQLATVLVMEPTVMYDLLLYLICSQVDTKKIYKKNFMFMFAYRFGLPIKTCLLEGMNHRHENTLTVFI